MSESCRPKPFAPPTLRCLRSGSEHGGTHCECESCCFCEVTGTRNKGISDA